MNKTWEKLMEEFDEVNKQQDKALKYLKIATVAMVIAVIFNVVVIAIRLWN